MVSNFSNTVHYTYTHIKTGWIKRLSKYSPFASVPVVGVMAAVVIPLGAPNAFIDWTCAARDAIGLAKYVPWVAAAAMIAACCCISCWNKNSIFCIPCSLLLFCSHLDLVFVCEEIFYYWSFLQVYLLILANSYNFDYFD